MKLIVLLLSGLFAHSQSAIEGWPLLRAQSQESHVLPMLIYFSSDHCLECEKFDALFEQPEMLQRLEQHYVSVRVSIDETAGKACADIYRIETVPAFVIADHKGLILYKSDETLSIEDVQLLLENVPGKYSTVNQPEEMIAEDNASTVGITSLIDDQSSEPVTGFPVEEPVVNLQHAESIPVIHEDETKPVQVVPVTTHIPEAPGSDQKNIATNVSPADKVVDHSEATETSTDANPKPAVTKSSPSTAVPTKSLASKPTVNVQRSYSIQLGYFTESVNSEKLVQRAKAKGLTATRAQTEIRDGKSCYRVLIGDFKTLAAAQAQLAEVHALGLKGAVHRQ